MKTVLNAHPDIYITGEMPFLVSIREFGYCGKTRFYNLQKIEDIRETLRKNDFYNSFENIDYDFNDECQLTVPLHIDDIFFTLVSSRNVVVNGSKTPQFTEKLDVLSNLFPNAFFLIVVRDIRDVCLSWRKKWGKHMLLCASKWAQRMHGGLSFASSHLESRSLFVKFEDLLLQTDEICRKICRFLGLDFSERMLEHHKYTINRIEGKINYGKSIKRDNTKKWKNQLDKKYINRIEEIAFDTMNLFGYVPEFAERHISMTPLEKKLGMLNDLYAMLFVGNRKSTTNTFRIRLRSLYIEIKKRS